MEKNTTVVFKEGKISVDWDICYLGEENYNKGYVVYIDPGCILYHVEGPYPMYNERRLLDILLMRFDHNPDSLNPMEEKIINLFRFGINVRKEQTFLGTKYIAEDNHNYDICAWELYNLFKREGQRPLFFTPNPFHELKGSYWNSVKTPPF